MRAFAQAVPPAAARGFYRACWRQRRIRNDPIKPARARADAGERMLRPSPPMSNAERQRLFRERNPGYYGRLHARQRARVKALAAQRAAVAQLLAVKPTPLMLPAPVVIPVIPGLNAIAAIPAAEPLPVSLPISQPVDRSIAA
jgi:hypothetical protein